MCIPTLRDPLKTALTLLATACLLAACGGGGGGTPARFPSSAPKDLVALVVDLDADADTVNQLVVSDVEGRGHVVFTSFEDANSGGVLDEGLVWSPDHTRLAYLAIPDGAERTHLFVLEPQGGAPVDILGTLLESLQLEISPSTIAWSPDGTRLAFSANEDLGIGHALVVRRDGSGLVDLLDASPIGTEELLAPPLWAPDGSRIAVRAKLAGAAGERAFTFLPDGSGFADATASPVPVSGADVGEIVWSPQSNRLLLRAELEQVAFRDAYVAHPDGSQPYVRVSPHTGGGNLVQASWSPDGTKVAYLSNLQTGTSSLDAFCVNADGTGHVKVSGTHVNGGSATHLFWAPDGSRLAFRADHFLDERFELFTVFPDGSGLVTVSLPLVNGGDVELSQNGVGSSESPWAPDSTRLAYIADGAVDGTENAFVVDADGSSSGQLTSAAAGCDMRVLRWSPDSERLLILANLVTPSSVDVFVANSRVNLGTVPQLSGQGGVTKLLRLFDWSVDGEFVVFAESVDGVSGQMTLGRSSPRTVADGRDLTDPAEDVPAARTR